LFLKKTTPARFETFVNSFFSSRDKPQTLHDVRQRVKRKNGYHLLRMLVSTVIAWEDLPEFPLFDSSQLY